MPTTVTSTIGTSSRNYSTLQAWEDACPSNLVTSDQIWRGEAYNDSEFVVSGVVLSIDGITSDSTRYLELTAAAGQSFQDNGNVRTNALKYNQSNGVGLRNSSNYYTTIEVGSISYVRVSRLQVKHGGGSGSFVISMANTGPGKRVTDMIVEFNRWGVYVAGSGVGVSFVSNLSVFQTGSNSSFAAMEVPACTVTGCTVRRTTDVSAAGSGFRGAYGTTLQSCASFGYTTPAQGSYTASSKNNATDQASGLPGSSNQYSVTYSSTSPFTNSTVASQDGIPVTGTALSANGYKDASYPNDITGTARSATPTIGCWELVSGGGGTAVPVFYYHLTQQAMA